jgi:hypothetical protein
VFTGKKGDNNPPVSIHPFNQYKILISVCNASDPDALSPCILKDKYNSEIILGSNL